MTETGFYPSRKLNKKSNSYIAELNLWPFVSVMIVLLCIFMLMPLPPFRPRYPADLALVRNAVAMPLARREDAMWLAVTRDGTLYFRNTKTSPMGLRERIRESLRDGAERRIYLAVDSRSRYGDVKLALDGVRDAGIERIALIVDKKRE